MPASALFILANGCMTPAGVGSRPRITPDALPTLDWRGQANSMA
jgi:hypothetical protein